MTARQLRPREVHVDKLKLWKESADGKGIKGLRLRDLTKRHQWSASRTPVEAALQYHILYEETTDVKQSIEVLKSAGVVTEEDLALAETLLATHLSVNHLETLLEAFAWSEHNPGKPIETWSESDIHGSNLFGPYKHLWRPWLNLRPDGEDTPEDSDFTPSVIDAPKADRRTMDIASPDTSLDSVSFDRTYNDSSSLPLEQKMALLDLGLNADSPSIRLQARARQHSRIPVRSRLPVRPVVTSYVNTEGSPAPTKGPPPATRASSRVPSGSLMRPPPKRASLPISSAALESPPARNAGSQDPSTPAHSASLSDPPRFSIALQPRGRRISNYEVQASHFLGPFIHTVSAEILLLDSVHVFYFIPQEEGYHYGTDGDGLHLIIARPDAVFKSRNQDGAMEISIWVEIKPCRRGEGPRREGIRREEASQFIALLYQQWKTMRERARKQQQQEAAFFPSIPGAEETSGDPFVRSASTTSAATKNEKKLHTKIMLAFDHDQFFIVVVTYSDAYVDYITEMNSVACSPTTTEDDFATFQEIGPYTVSDPVSMKKFIEDFVALSINQLRRSSAGIKHIQKLEKTAYGK